MENQNKIIQPINLIIIDLYKEANKIGGVESILKKTKCIYAIFSSVYLLLYCVLIYFFPILRNDYFILFYITYLAIFILWCIIFFSLSNYFIKKKLKILKINNPKHSERMQNFSKLKLIHFYKKLIKHNLLKKDEKDINRINQYIELLENENKLQDKYKYPMLGAAFVFAVTIAMFSDFFKWVLSHIKAEEMNIFWLVIALLIVLTCIVLKVFSASIHYYKNYMNKESNLRKDIIKSLEIVKCNLL